MPGRIIIAAALALGVGVTPASALDTLQFDLNGLSVQARNPADTADMAVPGGAIWSTPAFTGRLNIANDANATARILIDAVLQPFGPGYSPTGHSLTGFVSFSAGNVTGGRLTLSTNGSPDSSYTADLAAAGRMRILPGGERGVDGLAVTSSFANLGGPANARTFAGVDIDRFITAADGATMSFVLGPDAGGFDADAGIDLFIPNPVCPRVTEPPASRTACAGSAAFSIGVAGTGPFTYQWQVQTAPGVWQGLGNDPVPLPCGGGASAYAAPINSPTVTIHIRPCPGDRALPQRYPVRCIVTNDCGSTPSSGAVYTVCPPDLDCSGDVNANDISAYLNAWYADIVAGTLTADFNASGETDANDISAFINAWYAAIVSGGHC